MRTGISKKMYVIWVYSHYIANKLDSVEYRLLRGPGIGVVHDPLRLAKREDPRHTRSSKYYVVGEGWIFGFLALLGGLIWW